MSSPTLAGGHRQTLLRGTKASSLAARAQQPVPYMPGRHRPCGSAGERCRPAQLIIGLLCIVGALSCESRSEQPNAAPAKTSPNASIVPQPLLTSQRRTETAHQESVPADPSGTTTVGQHEPPPKLTYYRTSRLVRDTAKPERSAVPIVLDGVFAWEHQPVSAQLFGLSSEERKSALEAVQRKFSIDLRVRGRTEMQLLTAAFGMEPLTSLLAREDRFGFLLVWPSGDQFRVLNPGTLRALFRELRLDSTPMTPAIAKQVGEGRKFGFPSEISEFKSGHGRLRLEQVNIEGLGYGGTAICRMLLEFVAVAPGPECSVNRVPVAAEFEFEVGGTLTYAVTSLDKKLEPTKPLPTVPPRKSLMVSQGLPVAHVPSLSVDTLGALRRGSKTAEFGILTIQNYTNGAAHILLENTPLGVLAPFSRRTIRGLRPAAYSLRAVDFFGRELAARTTVQVPGKADIGAPPGDAGAP